MRERKLVQNEAREVDMNGMMKGIVTMVKSLVLKMKI